MRNPDFNNFLKMLRREPADRPVLYEWYIDWGAIGRLLGPRMRDPDQPPFGWVRNAMDAYVEFGHDAVSLGVPGFGFPTGRDAQHKETISQNEGGVIFDDASFENYPWPDPDKIVVKKTETVQSYLDIVASCCPEGMKVIMMSGGVMETLVNLVGFDNVCLMVHDRPDLVEKICREIGTRINRFFEITMAHPVVGAGSIADDWGYKTSTLLSPEILRRHIFPWHEQIAATMHAAGKPAILHACGKVDEVMDDVIDGMKYDAKHSFEDVILPVEEAYEKWGRRIAILGGFDVQFLSGAKPEAVYTRAKNILQQTRARGGYALGTGNSVTNYMPLENYLAMCRAVKEGY